MDLSNTIGQFYLRYLLKSKLLWRLTCRTSFSFDTSSICNVEFVTIGFRIFGPNVDSFGYHALFLGGCFKLTTLADELGIGWKLI
jgi:hypothetical protein